MNHETQIRKLEHIDICSNNPVESQIKTTYFEYVDFVHDSLPEIDEEKIDLSTTFFKKKLSAPIIIAGMTGGHKVSKKINQNLASAAQTLKIGMGLGSQRAMIENKELTYTYQVRDVAPDIFLIGNIGAPQLKKYSPKVINSAVQKVGADALAIHLNNLQEAVQPNGEINADGLIEMIKKFAQESEVPVIIKETGAGISKETAKKLSDLGISGIDVGGAGGTSFAAVEVLRKKDSSLIEFWDWGIPTAVSILEVRSASKLPLIATGGIRTGLDVAKALTLGADVAGIALPLLKPARKSQEEVVSTLNNIIKSLKTAMFLVGAKNIKELKEKKIMLSGRLLEWKKERTL